MKHRLVYALASLAVVLAGLVAAVSATIPPALAGQAPSPSSNQVLAGVNSTKVGTEIYY